MLKFFFKNYDNIIIFMQSFKTFSDSSYVLSLERPTVLILSASVYAPIVLN